MKRADSEILEFKPPLGLNQQSPDCKSSALMLHSLPSRNLRVNVLHYCLLLFNIQSLPINIMWLCCYIIRIVLGSTIYICLVTILLCSSLVSIIFCTCRQIIVYLSIAMNLGCIYSMNICLLQHVWLSYFQRKWFVNMHNQKKMF